LHQRILQGSQYRMKRQDLGGKVYSNVNYVKQNGQFLLLQIT